MVLCHRPASVILAFFALMCASLSFTDAAPLHIYADASADTWVRGSSDTYTVDIRIDNTQDPSLLVRAVRWSVLYPDILAFASAWLPDTQNPSTNPDDFFYGAVMNPDYNFVIMDSIVYGGGFMEIRNSFRMVQALRTGVSEHDGILGTFSFTVPDDAPLGEYAIYPFSLSIHDKDGVGYYLYDQHLTIAHAVITIADPDTFELGDFNSDGVLSGLDIPGFKSALADPDGWAAANPDRPHPNTLGDFNGDGVFSGLDIPGFKSALAGGATAIPEPVTLLALATGLAAALRRRRR